MKNLPFIILILLCLNSFTSCAQINSTDETREAVVASQKNETIKSEPHRYGGWYCPDNLGGFPPVDIRNWKNIPIVNGRMATKEEAQNGTSLIFVDESKYPNAKPLDMVMPKLASVFNNNSKRKELIIVIQAINVDNDSIVGYRFLNGGNGSGRLDEVTFLSDDEIEKIPTSQFVMHKIKIKATQDKIWEIITKSEYAEALQSTFDKDKKLKSDWSKTSNVNYNYPNTGFATSKYAGEMYGSYYIQNDYYNSHYNEKFFVSENKETKTSDLIIVGGPFSEDYEAQKNIINNWAQKVKVLSEKE